MLDKMKHPTLEEAKKKVFHTWIIPGLIIKPFDVTQGAMVVAPAVLDMILRRHGVAARELKPNKHLQKGKAIGSNEKVSYIRDMFWYFMRDVFKDEVTLKFLGKTANVVHHTTVMHGISKYKDFLDTNAKIPKVLQTMFPGLTVREDYVQFNEQIRPWL